VAIRALGDYQLTDEGTQRGTLNAPENGGYGPFTVLAGLIASFFLLSFLAAGGGRKAKIAVAAGALIDIVLLMKSTDEVGTVANFIAVDPASRTVQTASYTQGESQAWGAAEQIGTGSSALTLTAYTPSAPTAYGQTPFNLGSSGGVSTTAAVTPSSTSTVTPSSTASSSAIIAATSNPTSIFPTVSPSGITPGTT
jgi:hypothetical protein